MGESFEEIAQELVAAHHKVLMIRGAEEGADFSFGYGKPHAFRDFVVCHSVLYWEQALQGELLGNRWFRASVR